MVIEKKPLKKQNFMLRFKKQEQDFFQVYVYCNVKEVKYVGIEIKKYLKDKLQDYSIDFTTYTTKQIDDLCETCFWLVDFFKQPLEILSSELKDVVVVSEFDDDTVNEIKKISHRNIG